MKLLRVGARGAEKPAILVADASLRALSGITRDVAANEARNYVAGYCGVNDVSEREFQLERGGQWDKGKGCDTFGPIGPWLVSPDEAGDLANLDLWCDVNGRRMQT